MLSQTPIPEDDRKSQPGEIGSGLPLPNALPSATHSEALSKSIQPRIETIGSGGFGGEATVLVQLRNSFPGPGGIIITEQDAVVSYRVQNSVIGKIDTNGPSTDLVLDKIESHSAFDTFLRHVIIKKFDDYFFRTGRYRYSHIPRPLGCTADGAYLYEWIHGTEGYPEAPRNEPPIEIGEQIAAHEAFCAVGVNIDEDTACFDSGGTKNIIVQEQDYPACPEKISKLWKRIDFGLSSMHPKYDTMSDFINRKREDLLLHLGPDRLRMVELAILHLTRSLAPEDLPELMQCLYRYRCSTAAHLGIEGMSSKKHAPPPLPDLGALEKSRGLEKPEYIRAIRSSDPSILYLETRSVFPCVDGILYTMQEMAVARIERPLEDKSDAGFELFLRHFIIKKLENAFISQGIYSFPHVARPLGSESRSYFYEWEYGKAICPFEFLDHGQPSRKEKGLDEWYEFASSFGRAGIDMRTKLRPIPAEGIYHRKVTAAKQIVVRQPGIDLDVGYISRMWMRVNFHERSTAIDYVKLREYLAQERTSLLNHLTEGRYETMLLALRYLDGERDPAIMRELMDGIHKFRVSTLSHLNHRGFEP